MKLNCVCSFSVSIMLAKVVIALSLISVSHGARILGILPSPSYSHQVVFQPIWKELSLRGHQVTTLTTDPINDPLLVNLTEIDLSFSYKLIKGNVMQVVNSNQTTFNLILQMLAFLDENAENQLLHHEVQNLLKSETAKFDLVMVEYLMPCMIAFAEKFKCPHIGLLSMDAPNNLYESFGNPAHPILYPDIMLNLSKDLSLLDRIISALYTVLLPILVNRPLLASQQRLVEKYFGPNYPTLETMSKKGSLLFVNTDPIFHYVRPLVPAIIPIGGGSHRAAAKQLPKELKKILDGATSGFIYFSLGSNVKSNEISEKTLNVILATFGEIPYTVLWKYESEELPNKPSNVFISKWLPQQDILKHPNIKLFITQGGLQSRDEAIYEHVPMVAMPFFADQPYNAKKMVEKGYGLSLDFHTLEKEQFKETILEVIKNPKYRNKIKELAQLASDQPMTGLERAVWWTEYVLRHKGAKHLRSPALDIPWYQYFLLDVIGVLTLAFTILISIMYVLIKSIATIIIFFCSKFKSKVKVL